MILLTAPDGSGINPFFPLLVTERYRKIPVIEWIQYRRLLPLFILVNSICAGAFVITCRHPAGNSYDFLYTLANFATLAYVVCRLRFGRRMTTIDSSGIKKVGCSHHCLAGLHFAWRNVRVACHRWVNAHRFCIHACNLYWHEIFLLGVFFFTGPQLRQILEPRQLMYGFKALGSALTPARCWRRKLDSRSRILRRCTGATAPLHARG